MDRQDTKTNLIGFWRESDPLGCCSNWYPAGFRFAGEAFATSEHWMMWQKARAMGDWGMAERILEAPTPRKAKELGSQVAPYDGALWEDVREELVYYGVREKFLQNPDLADMLLSTGSALLAEASPYDRVWGVGLTADDPRFQEVAAWKGSNLLGRVCMRVRADLRQSGVPRDSISGATMDALPHVLYTQIGGMNLLELSRVPAARNAVLCYARIAQHRDFDLYPTVGEFLATAGRSSMLEISKMMETSMGGGLTVAGWSELVCQLAFLHAIGRL